MLSSAPDSAKGPPLTTAGPAISSKELNKIREAVAKIPDIESRLDKIMRDLANLDVSELHEKLKELARSLEGKSSREETKRLGDILQQHDKTQKELQRAIEELKTAGGKGPTIAGDIVVQINNKIDKIEFKLEGLDSELKELLKKMQRQKTVDFDAQPAATGGADEKELRRLEVRVTNVERDLKNLQNEMSRMLKEL